MKNYIPAKIFLCFLFLLVLPIAVLTLPSKHKKAIHRAQIAHHLGLYQMAVSCEAKHLRDFLFADYVSAFQDFPGYHDHFVGSSFLKPNLEKP